MHRPREGGPALRFARAVPRACCGPAAAPPAASAARNERSKRSAGGGAMRRAALYVGFAYRRRHATIRRSPLNPQKRRAADAAETPEAPNAGGGRGWGVGGVGTVPIASGRARSSLCEAASRRSPWAQPRSDGSSISDSPRCVACKQAREEPTYTYVHVCAHMAVPIRALSPCAAAFMPVCVLSCAWMRVGPYVNILTGSKSDLLPK